MRPVVGHHHPGGHLHNGITATFNSAGADTNFVSTATATTSVTVNKDSATVSLKVNSGSSATTTYGNENASVGSGGLSFSATVTATHGEAVPGTDTVTVTEGAVTVCSFTVSAGSCVPSTPIIPAGTYTNGITATFNSAGADTNFTSTSTGTTSVTVNKGTATDNVTSSVNPSVVGQAVTYTATVSGVGVTPTGSVTFKDGATAISTCGTGRGGRLEFPGWLRKHRDLCLDDGQSTFDHRRILG